MVSTLTAGELTKILSIIPHDMPVYITSDSEQNAYGTIDRQTISLHSEDRALIIGMFEDYLTEDEVLPKLMKRIRKELEAEGK